MSSIFEQWRGGLIVSCQAPADSPLAKPEIIAAFAETAEQNGAVGVRIDSPVNIAAVKAAVRLPVLGIYKIVTGTSDVYITPTFESAGRIAAAGADVIALDATSRARPGDEKLDRIVARIRREIRRPTAADVATFAEGVRAAEETGFDAVITTLSGYTDETKNIAGPDFDLIEKLASRVSTPVIGEGRLRSPADLRRAFDAGAFAVVVGNAITGTDQLVRNFVSALPAGKQSPAIEDLRFDPN
ncbi:MAG: N-acetylmannosamine-6-phosphate 2-epimerase [Acidobacteria bacterium]|nr:N-acetylmannosamine-6-phosphate 2-epimerase [Acidobacteriota bacterium]